MKDVLDKIIAHTRGVVAATDYGDIEQRARACKREVISMSRSIKESSTGGIIAEFKRRSPSKGWINESADVNEVVKGYFESGAAACSVLTNEEFFGGELSFLVKAREASPTLPLLRKEFIVDPAQIFEARVAGADAILLIAAALSVEECYHLAQTAHSLSLEVLLEVHSEGELSHLNEYIDMLGVNNRNLGTFVTDIDNSFRMAERMRAAGGDIVLVSESGIDSSATIKELQEAGFRGFLIGETFMRESSPAEALSQLISEL